MFPQVLRIEPAAKCNLSCSHCPTGTIEMARGLMSEVTFERVLLEIADHHLRLSTIVFYHGGEPLLNKNIFTMIERVRYISSRLKLKLVTNGMGLNSKNSIRLMNAGLDEIEISLDGVSSVESEAVRIGSNSEKILKNIHDLIALRNEHSSSLNIAISTTQFLREKNDIEKVDDLLKEVPSWLYEEFEDSVQYKPCVAMRWPHMTVGSEYEEMMGSGADKNYCNHTYETITVRSNGDIVPCCYDLTSQMVMGNIHDEALATIFNGAKYKELRKNIFDKDFRNPCVNCNKVRSPVYLVRKQSAV